ncbi:general stress protein [Stenotrophomonas maltophilia]|nr:general stress protein [Stenotrophomonas maltophilia]
MTEQNHRSNRGFASMDQAKQRAIAAKGGRAAHASGNAHEFSRDEARAAGRKGGEAISRDRRHMAAIGREGGHARHANARQQQQQQQQQQQIEHGGEAPHRQQK